MGWLLWKYYDGIQQRNFLRFQILHSPRMFIISMLSLFKIMLHILAPIINIRFIYITALPITSTGFPNLSKYLYYHRSNLHGETVISITCYYQFSISIIYTSNITNISINSAFTGCGKNPKLSSQRSQMAHGGSALIIAC